MRLFPPGLSAIILLLGLLCPLSPAYGQSGFVTVNNADSRFMMNGEPFYFNGTNLYWLPAWTIYGQTPVVLDGLDAAKATGMKVVRTAGFNEKAGDPAIMQTAPGVYNENALVALDFVIWEAGKRDIKLIIPLTNGQDFLGGRAVYAQWAGLSNADDFYSDPVAKQMYKDHVFTILNRLNTYTGIAYKDDPTIMAWEASNEAYMTVDTPEEALGIPLRDWYREMAIYMKSLDPNHLVGTGEIGFDVDDVGFSTLGNDWILRGQGDTGSSYKRNTAIPEIDFASVHIYPETLGYSPTEANQLIADYARLARDHGKPLYLGEYGMETDRSYYQQWLVTIDQEDAAGTLLWQFLPESHGREWGADVMYPTDTALVSMLSAHSIVMNAKSGPPDPNPPSVAITNPQSGQTVTAPGLMVSGTASDDNSVTLVRVRANSGTWTLASGFDVWEATVILTAAGSNLIEAQSLDQSGNTSAIVSIVVDYDPPPAPPVAIFQEALAVPWIDASYSLRGVDFNNTSPVYAGSRSLAVDQLSWGALSLHRGDWGYTEPIEAALYQSLDFAIHGGDNGMQLNMWLQNDAEDPFPTFEYGAILANQWTLVSIPMANLNPDGYQVDKVTIQDNSGGSALFYLDQVLFVPLDAAPGDVTPPSVSINTPADGATVTGTISVAATASDDMGNVAVQFQIDGGSLGADLLSAPFELSWNSAAVRAGTHTLTAIARDGAGNQTTSTPITVEVLPYLAPPAPTIVVYDDAIPDPWIDTSWGVSYNVNNTAQVYSGSKSIRLNQDSWGAFRLHSGEWGETIPIAPELYQTLDMMVNGGPQGVLLNIYLGNDQDQEFPSVLFGQVPANQWSSVSIPMSQLNPAGYPFDIIGIQDFTGNSSVRYHLDDVKFVPYNTGGIDTEPPTISVTAPQDSATVSGMVTLSASATDDVGGLTVQFLLNGGPLGSPTTQLPFEFTGNSAKIPDGVYTVSASVTDGAGNQTVSDPITVFVAQTSPPPTPPLIVYDDAITAPWINSSWGISTGNAHTTPIFSGDKSLRIDQEAWGAGRVHSGEWGETVPITPALYESLDLRIHGGPQGVLLNVFLGNDQDQDFPSVLYGQVPANEWTHVSIPMAQLNPEGNPFDILGVQDFTGNTPVRYYLDDIKFVPFGWVPEDDTTAPTVAEGKQLSAQKSGPTSFALKQNYPNPFNPATQIAYDAPRQSAVRLVVYNIMGQEVRTLLDEVKAAGSYSVQWNGRNDAGNPVTSGVYLYLIHADGFTEAKRMILLK